MTLFLPLWQRLAVTFIAMLAVSYVAGLICQSVFSVELPNYAAGVIGGLTALPVWEFMKRLRPGKQT